MTWTNCFYLLGMLVAGWFIYRQIKNNPLAFSKESFSKSTFTLGVLALMLIGFIALLVLLLRA